MLYDELIQALAEELMPLQDCASALAEIDVLTNLAERAENLRLVQPKLVKEPQVKIEQGRHLVIENLISDPFVANDTHLNHDTKVQIITGPNMGGKSTYMRSEEHTSELQSRPHLVCRLLLEKKK